MSGYLTEQTIKAYHVDIHDLVRYEGAWVEVVGYEREYLADGVEGITFTYADGNDETYPVACEVRVQRESTGRTQTLKKFMGL